MDGSWSKQSKPRLASAFARGIYLPSPSRSALPLAGSDVFLQACPIKPIGNATTLPWGVDFGDGIRRHPTQLYEIAFLLLLCPLLFHGLKAVARSTWQTGDVFRVFMIAYSLWRIGVDFLKPEPKVLGMSALQWASLGVVAYCWRDLMRIVLRKASDTPALLMKAD